MDTQPPVLVFFLSQLLLYTRFDVRLCSLSVLTCCPPVSHRLSFLTLSSAPPVAFCCDFPARPQRALLGQWVTGSGRDIRDMSPAWLEWALSHCSLFSIATCLSNDVLEETPAQTCSPASPRALSPATGPKAAQDSQSWGCIIPCTGISEQL